MAILVDTNVVIRFFDRASPQHAECQRAVEELYRRGEDPVVCAQVMIEFWSVATRPVDVNGMGLSAAEAGRYVEGATRVFPCLLEPQDVLDRWRDVVSRYNVLGKQVHDARLVAVMLAHGVGRVLTLNPGHFGRFKEVESVTPGQVVGGAG